MFITRFFSSIILFFFAYLAFLYDFFFIIFFIHILSFFSCWEFIRLLNYKSKNFNKVNVLNNFYLTRNKLSLFDYFNIFLIQIFLLIYEIDKLSLVALFFLLTFFCFFLIRKNKNIIYLIGIIYIVLPFFILLFFKNMDKLAFFFPLIFIIVISTDIGAYFFGKSFGGPKLLKSVSPKKTWSGLIGGIIISIFSSLIYYQNSTINFEFIFLILVLSVFCQIGDLFESFFKRLCGVKDSSNLIPGHGGVLDRLDGALFLINFMFFLYIINFDFQKILIS